MPIKGGPRARHTGDVRIVPGDVETMQATNAAPRRQRIVARYVILATAVVGAVSYVLWNSREVVHYVDIHSGRNKTVVRVVGISINETTCDTAFSRLVARAENAADRPEWRVYWSRSWDHPISPHYQFHSVPHDLNALVCALRATYDDEAEVRSRCRYALALLETGDARSLESYVAGVLRDPTSIGPCTGPSVLGDSTEGEGR